MRRQHFDAHMDEQTDFIGEVETFYMGQGSAAAQ
jgi:hypothetical protein